MTFIHFDSVTDQEKNLCVTKESAVVSMLKKTGTETDQISIVVEELNDKNQILITHYFIYKNPKNLEEYKVKTESGDPDEPDPKLRYHHLLCNERYDSKSWSIPKFKAKYLHKYMIENSKGHYNELGPYSTGPMTGVVTKKSYALTSPQL